MSGFPLTPTGAPIVNDFAIDLLNYAVHVTPVSPESGYTPQVFNANWETEVTVETRWLTDVSKNLDNQKAEKAKLSSRPSRRLTATISGMSKEEAFALRASLFAQSKAAGSCVPLYPDSLELTSTPALVGADTFIECNPLLRRFFPGALIFLFGSGNRKILTTLRAVALSGLTIAGDHTAALSTGVWVACPALNVEALPSVTVGLLSDELCRASITWTELESHCTLPALWADCCEQVSLAAPLTEVVDGLALFPLALNWNGSPSAGIVADVEENASGRSVIQEMRGRPLHRFELPVSGLSREETWAVLRWFDAMRARAGTWGLVDLQEPWSLHESTPASGTLRVKKHTDAAAFQAVSYVLIQSTTGKQVRKVTSFVDGGDFIVATVAGGYSGTATDAQPLYIVSFEEDALTETYTADGLVPSFILSAIEQDDHSSAQVVALVENINRQAPINQVPQIFLRAGIGLNGGVFPATGYSSNYWRDCRSAKDPRPFARFSSTTGAAPGSSFSHRYNDVQRDPNGGSPSQWNAKCSVDYWLPLINPEYIAAQDNPRFGQGTTTVLCISPMQVPLSFPPNHEFFRFSGTLGGLLFDIFLRRLSLDMALGGSAASLPLTLDFSQNRAIVLAFRHTKLTSTSQRLEVWQGKTLVNSQTFNSFPIPSDLPIAQSCTVFSAAVETINYTPYLSYRRQDIYTGNAFMHFTSPVDPSEAIDLLAKIFGA